VLQRVEVEGGAVLVARTTGGWPVVVAPICPHQQRPMDGGNVYRDEVDCPHHHYTYDARTGENRYPKRVFPRARAAAIKPIQVFESREQAGWIWCRAPSEPSG
jgi:nitrite reductase/ring-hydroxylating ferredoxin subunit